MLIHCYSNSGNKFQWNLSKNSNLFIQENAFENIVCEKAFASFRLILFIACMFIKVYCVLFFVVCYSINHIVIIHHHNIETFVCVYSLNMSWKYIIYCSVFWIWLCILEVSLKSCEKETHNWIKWLSYCDEKVVSVWGGNSIKASSVFDLWLNTLGPIQRGRLFAGDSFTWIFLNESEWVFIDISLDLVPKGQIAIFQHEVQIMAWRQAII